MTATAVERTIALAGSAGPSRFSTATDGDLVRAAAAGDRDAAAAVWERYAAATRRRLRAHLGLGEDLEDLLQDVFVTFLASVRRVRNPDALGAYLLAISTTVARTQVRRKRVRRLVCLSDTGEMPEVAGALPDFEGREALLVLQRALDRMHPRVRRGYCLFYFAGLGVTEVARTLGVSCSTAKRVLSRARKRLVVLAPRFTEEA